MQLRRRALVHCQVPGYFDFARDEKQHPSAPGNPPKAVVLDEMNISPST